MPLLLILRRASCCAEESAAENAEASANRKGDSAQQQNEPAVVHNGFVMRLSGHSSGSEGRTFSGQASMQSIPEGKAHLPECLSLLHCMSIAQYLPIYQSCLSESDVRASTAHSVHDTAGLAIYVV